MMTCPAFGVWNVLLLTLNDNTIKLNNFKTINPFGRDGSQKKKRKKNTNDDILSFVQSERK